MNKITLNDVNKMMSFSPTDKVEILFDTVDGDKITIKVKPYLSLLELSDIIDTSVNACFTSEGFAPEYKDVVFAWKVIDVMTDLPKLITKEKTADLAKTYEVATKLNLIDRIMGADERLFDLILKLNTMIDEKLEFQKALLTHPDRDGEVVEAITGFISNLNNIVSKYADNLDNVDLQKLAPAIMELSKNKLDKDAIQTILEVGSASKVGNENVPNLEVVK
jgi:hypothetical protein